MICDFVRALYMRACVCAASTHAQCFGVTVIDARARADPDTIVYNACITYKEGRFEQARARLQEAMTTIGYSSELA